MKDRKKSHDAGSFSREGEESSTASEVKKAEAMPGSAGPDRQPETKIETDHSGSASSFKRSSTPRS